MKMCMCKRARSYIMILIYDSTLIDAHSITVMDDMNAHLTIAVLNTAMAKAECLQTAITVASKSDFEYKLARNRAEHDVVSILKWLQFSAFVLHFFCRCLSF